MSFIQKPKRSSSASKKLPQDTSLRSSWRSNANANQNTPLGLSMLPKEKKTSQIPYYISLFTINIRPDFISGLLKIEERISYYHYETMDHHTRTIHCPNMKITNLTVTAEDTVVSIDKEVQTEQEHKLRWIFTKTSKPLTFIIFYAVQGALIHDPRFKLDYFAWPLLHGYWKAPIRYFMVRVTLPLHALVIDDTIRFGSKEVYQMELIRSKRRILQYGKENIEGETNIVINISWLDATVYRKCTEEERATIRYTLMSGAIVSPLESKYHRESDVERITPYIDRLLEPFDKDNWRAEKTGTIDLDSFDQDELEEEMPTDAKSHALRFTDYHHHHQHRNASIEPDRLPGLLSSMRISHDVKEPELPVDPYFLEESDYQRL